MYNNFHQNLVSRSIITVHTNLFAKKSQMHKFATTNSKFEKIYYVKHAILQYMYINFLPNRVSRSVKTVHTNLFAKKL